MDKISLGMLLDILRAYSGDDDSVLDDRYKKLKSIETLVEERFKNGEIDKQKYDDFKVALKEYEEG